MSSRSDISFLVILFLLTVFPPSTLRAESSHAPDVEWHAETSANIGNGKFAPYYISALQHGKITQAKGWLADASVRHRLDTACRFSWEACVELCAGVSSNVAYTKWTPEGTTFTHNMSGQNFWVQQLYALIKWRSLFVLAGMKEHRSTLLDNTLTSGDLVESGNARPIPEVRIGLIGFRDVPLTKHWVQAQAELAYGKFADKGWMEEFYGRASSHINTGAFYIYRRLYLRSRPSENFCFTFGMQAAGEIGGTTREYRRGVLVKTIKLDDSMGKLLEMIIPVHMDTREPGGYFNGNNLGSWDFLLRYRMPFRGHEVRAYLQKPWEKGSSVGWHNGWDGLWGFEYLFGKGEGILDAFLFEYIYTMNQSGPIHFAPHDQPGSTITSDVSGGDQYYNNSEYNGYANYGVGIGSPFLKAPIYNTDGYLQYTDNRLKGFHMAARGHLAGNVEWKIAISYRKSYGDGRLPRTRILDDFSWLAEVNAHPRSLPRLSFNARIAMDRGSLLGNKFGCALSVTYKGDFNLIKK